MSSAVWQCPECGEKQEEAFTACWKCGYVRGSGGDESVKEREGGDPMICPNCKLTLDFVGTKKFHEGSRAAPFILGELGELFVKREHFDVYVCSRCGRVELFLDGVGEELVSKVIARWRLWRGASLGALSATRTGRILL